MRQIQNFNGTLMAKYTKVSDLGRDGLSARLELNPKL